MAHKRRSEGCEVDMTPMIDVVFQLIIFFIVTLKMDESRKEEIELAEAKDGPVIENQDPKTTAIEVDEHGWISMHGAQLTKLRLRRILKTKYDRNRGPYPVLIRGDRRARHEDIRSVMDICTSVGIWRINFAAIYEKKT